MALPSKPELVIGMDIGTTYSSAVYYTQKAQTMSFDGRPRPVVLQRLNEIYFDSDKQVKTELAWHPLLNDWAWGSGVDMAIDHKAIQGKDRIQFIKLGMDGLDDFPFVKDIRLKQRRQLRNLPAEAGSLSTHHLLPIFLGHFFKAIISNILSRVPLLRGQSIVERATVRCIISVPAIWKFKTNNLMLDAAKVAGIPNAEVVSEPEAAATMIMLEETGKSLQGQPFTVCDGGGGTADLVSYLPKSEEVPMQEGTRGINRYLDVRRRRDREQDREAVLDMAVAEFERAKKCNYFDGFSSDLQRHQVIINLPGIERDLNDEGVDADFIRLPKRFIESIYAKIIKPLITMIEEQIQLFNEKHLSSLGRRIEHVIVVGGLSRSNHVRNTLRMHFETLANMGYFIHVLWPYEDSGTLIAKGAIVRTLYRDVVGEKYLRCSIGFAQDEPYDETIHTEVEDAGLNGIHGIGGKVQQSRYIGVEFVLHRINWLFQVNEAIRLGTKKSIRGFRFAPTTGTIDIDEFVFCCDRDTPDHVPINDTTYGSLSCKLSQSQRSRFLRRPMANGKGYYHYIDYEVVVEHRVTDVKYAIIIPRNGEFPDSPANDESDWGPLPIKVDATLDYDVVYDTTKQRQRILAEDNGNF
ncbi:MAG: hypothetical protein Q9217_000737 [Psora testacea]